MVRVVDRRPRLGIGNSAEYRCVPIVIMDADCWRRLRPLGGGHERTEWCCALRRVRPPGRRTTGYCRNERPNRHTDEECIARQATRLIKRAGERTDLLMAIGSGPRRNVR